MQCEAHPKVETNLTCGKCGKAICPRCMVQTDVGVRCVKCAGLKKLPTFKLTGTDYAKAILVGLGIALVAGAIWYFIPHMVLVNLLIAAGVGYGIGELTSLSINRKRGLPLKIIAGICVVLAFAIGNQVVLLPFHFILSFNLFNLIAIGIGIYLAISRL
jgi:hypothetical protein